MENCLLYDAIQDFSVRLRTGCNPADITRFRSHTGNIVTNKNTIFHNNEKCALKFYKFSKLLKFLYIVTI